MSGPDPGTPARDTQNTVAQDDAYWNTPLAPDEEPVVTGTLFFVILILIIIGAIWVIMYIRLLDR